MAVKPTSFALNMEFDVPEGGGAFLSISDLARRAPGKMKEIAKKNTSEVQRKGVVMNTLSWQQLLAQGHVPFRRACAICQREP